MKTGRFVKFFMAMFISSALAACGGGGGGSSSNQAAQVLLSGTVATGAPVANSILTVRDSAGTTVPVTTGEDGTYELDTSALIEPFLLRAYNEKAGKYMYSHSGSKTGTANVHPLTDPIVRAWYKVKGGDDVDTSFATVGALELPSATEMAVIKAVVTEVMKEIIVAAGLPANFDPMTDTFTAYSTVGTEEGFDKILADTNISSDGAGIMDLSVKPFSSLSTSVTAFSISSSVLPIDAGTGTISLAADTTAPDAPISLSGVALTHDKMLLTWTPSASGDTLGYKIYLAGSMTALATVPVPVYVAENLTASTEYDYEVKAFDAAGNLSDASTMTPVTTSADAGVDAIAPNAPTGLVATMVDSGRISLSWMSSTTDVAAYEIYRDGTAIARISTISGGGTITYLDFGLVGSTAYDYTVKAIDAAGNPSAESSTASATTGAPADPAPTVPTFSNVTASDYNVVDLTWNASTDAGSNLSGYIIYRGTGSIVQEVALAAAGTTTYADTGLLQLTEYNYWVQAFDTAGQRSSLDLGTPMATVTTPEAPDVTPPSVPADLTAEAVDAFSIDLSWSASTDDTGVAGYRIYRDNLEIATTTGLSYSDTLLTPGTNYSYEVTAFDAAQPANESAESSSASADTPNILAAGSYDFTHSWTNSADVPSVVSYADMTIVSDGLGSVTVSYTEEVELDPYTFPAMSGTLSGLTLSASGYDATDGGETLTLSLTFTDDTFSTYAGRLDFSYDNGDPSDYDTITSGTTGSYSGGITYNAADYLPLNNGDTFTYQTEGSYYTNTVTYPVSANGYSNIYGLNDHLLEDPWYIMVEADGYHWMEYDDIAMQWTEGMLLPATFSIGDIYISGVDETIEILAIEDVTVPAGTFSGCVKYKETDIEGYELGWICPDVGFVKWEEPITLESDTLVYASVDGVEYGTAPVTTTSASIVGSWGVAAGPADPATDHNVIIFYPNGIYFQWCNAGGGCSAAGSAEIGRYTYSNGQLTITEHIINGEGGFDDPNDPNAIPPTPIDVTVDGDLLTFVSYNNMQVSRIIDAANPVVGSWGSALPDPNNLHVVEFYPNGTYFQWVHPNEGVTGCGDITTPYAELGTYSYTGSQLTILSHIQNGVGGFDDDADACAIPPAPLDVTAGSDLLTGNLEFARIDSITALCGYESGWDDVTNEPATFNSFTDFETVVTACGGAQTKTAADFNDTTWVESWNETSGAWQEVVVFNSDGTVTSTETLDGVPQGTPEVLNWSVTNNLLSMTAVDQSWLDVWAFTAGGQKVYSEELGWSSNPDLVLDGIADGEIWIPNFVQQ